MFVSLIKDQQNKRKNVDEYGNIYDETTTTIKITKKTAEKECTFTPKLKDRKYYDFGFEW